MTDTKSGALIALPIALSALLLGAWWLGDTPERGRANAELVLNVFGPLIWTSLAISVLRRGAERALVLPTPIMLWLVFSSSTVKATPGPALTVALAAVVAMLLACWRGRRGWAQGAAAVCGAAALWLQLSAEAALPR